jgi:hypothetical protein
MGMEKYGSFIEELASVKSKENGGQAGCFWRKTSSFKSPFRAYQILANDLPTRAFQAFLSWQWLNTPR